MARPLQHCSRIADVPFGVITNLIAQLTALGVSGEHLMAANANPETMERLAVTLQPEARNDNWSTQELFTPRANWEEVVSGVKIRAASTPYDQHVELQFQSSSGSRESYLVFRPSADWHEATPRIQIRKAKWGSVWIRTR